MCVPLVRVLGVLGQSESNQHWSKNWKAWGYPIGYSIQWHWRILHPRWFTMIYYDVPSIRLVFAFHCHVWLRLVFYPRKDSQRHPSMTRAKLVTSSIHFNKKVWSSMMGKTIRFVEKNWHLRSSQLGWTPGPASIVTWTMPWAQAQLMTWSFGNLYIDIHRGKSMETSTKTQIIQTDVDVLVSIGVSLHFPRVRCNMRLQNAWRNLPVDDSS